jgi:hypothetical protein
VEFVVDIVALGQVSSVHFGFSCQFSLRQMFHNILLPGAGTLGRLVADLTSELSLTPSHGKKGNASLQEANPKYYMGFTARQACSGLSVCPHKFYPVVLTCKPNICTEILIFVDITAHKLFNDI